MDECHFNCYSFTSTDAVSHIANKVMAGSQLPDISYKKHWSEKRRTQVASRGFHSQSSMYRPLTSSGGQGSSAFNLKFSRLFVDSSTPALKSTPSIVSSLTEYARRRRMRTSASLMSSSESDESSAGDDESSDDSSDDDDDQSISNEQVMLGFSFFYTNIQCHYVKYFFPDMSSTF